MNKYEIIKRLKELREEYGSGIEHMDDSTKAVLFPYLLKGIDTIVEEFEEQ